MNVQNLKRKILLGTLGILLLSSNESKGQPAMGKTIDCSSPEASAKFVPLLADYMNQMVQQNAAMRGTIPAKVLDVQVVSATLVFAGAPAYEGMLYEECLLTGVAIIQSADGQRTGRVPIPNLPVRLGYDQQGNLRVGLPSGGKIY